MAVAKLQAQFPNWNPNPASPEYRMFLALAGIVAELIVLAFNVPEAIIQFVGAVVYQTPLTAATYATGVVTFHATGTACYTIEAGTVVLIAPEGEPPIGYEVTKEVVIAPGATEGSANIQAIESGASSNVPGASTCEAQEKLTWISSVTLTTTPSGGAEEETVQEYTKRIVELARLIAPRPILPEDFANYVRLLVTKEKVLRCVAIDQLELEVSGGHTVVNGSGEGTVVASNVERCVTVIAMNEKGEHLSAAAREQAEEILKAGRETTFKTFVAGPTINSITIAVTGTYYKGYTKSIVEANIEAAMKSLLSASWGAPQSGDLRQWINRKTLRYQDVIAALNNVEGFNYYTALTVNGGTADVALTGIAPITSYNVASAYTLTEGSE